MTLSHWFACALIVCGMLLLCGSGKCAADNSAGQAAQAEGNQGETSTSLLQSEPVIPERMHVAGLRNFGEITPSLYRGGQPSDAGFEALAKMGVTIVVDLRLTGRERERAEVERLGMRFVDMGWLCVTPKDEDMAQFLDLIMQNPGAKIFVHCATGDDRTGMEVAAYRMAVEGWSEPEARKEMEKFGFGLVHRRLCTGLGSYETHFPERFATSPKFERVRDNLDSSHAAQH